MAGVSSKPLAPRHAPKVTAAKGPAPKAPPPPQLDATLKSLFHDVFETGRQTVKVLGPFVSSGEPLKAGGYGESRGFGKASASGKISKQQWADPTQLVGHLTQYPARGKTAQSSAACSAANLLGIALITGGSESAAKLLTSVATAKYTGKLTDKEKAQLSTIADKVKNHTATFEDLNAAQELMYRSANSSASAADVIPRALEKLKGKDRVRLQEIRGDPSKEAEINKLLAKALGPDVQLRNGEMEVTDKTRLTDDSGLDHGELQNLGQASGGRYTSTDVTDGEPPTMTAEALKLGQGEAVILKLGSDANDTNPDHYVTIGRQKDGTYYIYNPDPAKKDHVLVVGTKDLNDPKFQAELARYNERMVDEGVGNDMHLPPALTFRME